MLTDCIVGWDIGGAHVKASIFYENTLKEVIQLPCPLWQGVSNLEEVVDRILGRLAATPVYHAVTMTGEMADLFQGREDGVRRILATLRARIEAQYLYVFAGRKGMLAFDSLNSSHYPQIASANWLASASCASKMVDSALLIDIGSTTTDILVLNEGQVITGSISDYERLVSGELVYTGIARTPVVVLAKQVHFEGDTVPLMAEIFATSADVYRVTGELHEDWDCWPTTDGGAKSVKASARRLARMIGRDLQSAPMNSWLNLAASLRENQLRSIHTASIKQFSKLDANAEPVVIGAGVGRFLAMEVSSRMNLEYQDFASVCRLAGGLTKSSDCAPAISVAKLLAKHSTA